MKPKPLALNRTQQGRIACCFGTPWLDHFAPPIGTGRECLWCQAEADRLGAT